jgi:hypothetical protein
LHWARETIGFKRSNEHCSSAGVGTGGRERIKTLCYTTENALDEQWEKSWILLQNFKELIAHPVAVRRFAILTSRDMPVYITWGKEILPVGIVSDLLHAVRMQIKCREVHIPVNLKETRKRIIRTETRLSKTLISSTKTSTLH